MFLLSLAVVQTANQIPSLTQWELPAEGSLFRLSQVFDGFGWLRPMSCWTVWTHAGLFEDVPKAWQAYSQVQTCECS